MVAISSHFSFMLGSWDKKPESMYDFPLLCSGIHWNTSTQITLMSFKTNKLEITSAEILAGEVLCNMNLQAGHILSKCELAPYSLSFNYPLKQQFKKKTLPTGNRQYCLKLWTLKEHILFPVLTVDWCSFSICQVSQVMADSNEVSCKE